MRPWTARAVTYSLVLALLWVGLPVHSAYAGGPCNYDVRTWGLYGWARVFEGHSATGPHDHTEYYTPGLALTVAASTLVTAAGARWVSGRGGRGQRAAGLVVFLAPATLLVAVLWWPDVYAVSGGGGGGYHYSRGYFGYLVEHREVFEPPGFPPYATEVTGATRLDPHGLAATGVVSIAVLVGAVWLGTKSCRWGCQLSARARRTGGGA